MVQALDIHDFMSESAGHLTLDVRSQREYETGHIPHALNLPLFNNEERAKVGTTYKQVGKEKAIEQGLDIVGPKMGDFVRYVKPLVRDKKIFVHCWRGGMRSGSMAWLFSQMGYEVCTLSGGYKAYRRYVLDDLARPRRLAIIGGRTGSGKTELLHLLRERGEQILDIEGLANHRGSAFGAIGLAPQPATEHFENLMHLQLSQLDDSRRIWLEDESKNTGSCVITDGFWKQMRTAPLYVIDMEREARVTRLVRDYSSLDAAALEASIRQIEKRLGNEAMKQAIAALHSGDHTTVVRLTLHYYDKAYDHSLTNRAAHTIKRIHTDTDDVRVLVDKLLEG